MVIFWQLMRIRICPKDGKKNLKRIDFLEDELLKPGESFEDHKHGVKISRAFIRDMKSTSKTGLITGKYSRTAGLAELNAAMKLISTTSLAPNTPEKGRNSAQHYNSQDRHHLDIYTASFNKLKANLCVIAPLTPDKGSDEEKAIPLLTYARKSKALISSRSSISDEEHYKKKLTLPIIKMYARRSKLARKSRQTSTAENKDPSSSTSIVKKITRKKKKSCTSGVPKRASGAIEEVKGVGKKRRPQTKAFVADAKEKNHDEKWLEEERELFCRHADVFITCMRHFLGDRRFSKWNGSVVDAVVGAFLTQNVSDHLSSSAYMSLGASFCHQSRGKYNTRQSAKGAKKFKTRTAKKKIDWEKLRREVLAKAPCKRKRDTMDSSIWESVGVARVDEISKAIRGRGMNNRLAERIKDFLNRLVNEHGSIDLEWLRYLPSDKAKQFLTSIHGIGPKSAECISLLTLQNIAFPVDTNVARICVRLGWVPLQPLPESLQLHLLKQYPLIKDIQKYLWPRLCTLDQQTLYELHYQMITFGKVFCTKSKPNCISCPMKIKCKHFASEFASSRLALREEEENRSSPLQLEGTSSTTGSASNVCEPIIEEPRTPDQECGQFLECDMEDIFSDVEEIPTINLRTRKFKASLKNTVMSKVLVSIPETASIPMAKLKNANCLRTKHLVYELPDSHPLLKEMDQRVPDDPSHYLFAIWTPGEIAQSTEVPELCCYSQGSAMLCDSTKCTACSCIREAQTQLVRGTILIPCRTAMKGSFPLNGTYFQLNEVFADHGSSLTPINVLRESIWHLRKRTVYFGTTVSTIVKGLTEDGISDIFRTGFVCVRGFDRESRTPKPLVARLHCSSMARQKSKKTTKNEKTRPVKRKKRSTSSYML